MTSRVLYEYTYFIIKNLYRLMNMRTYGYTTINIAGLYSNEEGLWRVEVVRVYADIAVEMINNNTNILQGYKLNIT